MDNEQLESYLKLGEEHSYILEQMRRKIEPGASVLDLVEESERLVRERGYSLAFPTNLSINEVAAHYTPFPGDELRIPETGLIKLDMGSHLEGWIVDAARSVALDEKYEEMVQVAREALDRAIERMIPGSKIREVSEAIYDTIVSAGYKPIRNLTGHMVRAYELHAGVEVPNVPTGRSMGYRIKDGDIFAIEPFVTFPEARGYVVPLGEPLIFSLGRKKGRTRDEMERRILKIVEKNYKGLPFCERWLFREIGHRVNHALSRLVDKRILIPYPPLVEVSGMMVAQYEDTVLVTADGPLRLTGEGD